MTISNLKINETFFFSLLASIYWNAGRFFSGVVYSHGKVTELSIYWYLSKYLMEIQNKNERKTIDDFQTYRQKDKSRFKGKKNKTMVKFICTITKNSNNWKSNKLFENRFSYIQTGLLASKPRAQFLFFGNNVSIRHFVFFSLLVGKFNE